MIDKLPRAPRNGRGIIIAALIGAAAFLILIWFAMP